MMGVVDWMRPEACTGPHEAHALTKELMYSSLILSSSLLKSTTWMTSSFLTCQSAKSALG
ncbi:Hypothetical protein FKW44_013406 [Caligus rogercresseyi]|uniref:Uncharacterized protein n=1 Tax=Caligus rogercresseyi TaxID=217165 RepID=A0A7T8KB84_CALRO|nr:Hypothetical protein FKW44_013406 [Caligus rogercresseyi]